jgi:phage anti-repressor protein
MTMRRNDQNQTEGALVPVQEGEIGGVKTLVVDARELHGFLGVGKDFTTWARGRLKEYGFEQGKDYEVFTKSGENPQGGRPLAEYTRW